MIPNIETATAIEKAQQKERDSLITAILNVMRTEAGKVLIWELLDLCDIHSDIFTGNSQTFYLEGKRSVGLQILQLLEEADPEFYPMLLLERAKQSKVNK